MPVIRGKIQRRGPILRQLCVGRYREEDLFYASYAWEDTEERTYSMTNKDLKGFHTSTFCAVLYYLSE